MVLEPMSAEQTVNEQTAEHVGFARYYDIFKDRIQKRFLTQQEWDSATGIRGGTVELWHFQTGRYSP